MSARNEMSASEGPPGNGLAAGGDFTTTHWSVVLLAGQEGSADAATALERLCRMYWYPLYVYARRQGHNPSDGQDLTQQFFSVFLEKKYFGMADPDRGRFRSFLLSSFKHFLANEYHRGRAARRGGRCSFISWDAAGTEERYRHEPASDTTPDKVFERAWALTLLEKVMLDLRSEYTTVGKENLFNALQVFLSGEKSETTYVEIGQRLEMGESAVKMSVLRLRRRYGELLRSEIAHTVTGASNVEEELRHLRSALSR